MSTGLLVETLISGGTILFGGFAMAWRLGKLTQRFEDLERSVELLLCRVFFNGDAKQPKDPV